ncbi:MAG: PHP domain-containing protein, partial [Cytophagales bacterium]|nr:PHP domain-containing protein [Cytophagales bacterium]
MYLIFDTETTGRALNFNAPLTDFANWPRCVQLAWQLHRPDGSLVEQRSFLIQPDGFDIPYEAVKIHGITTERAKADGRPLAEVLEEFSGAVAQAEWLVGHNLQFDLSVMGCELLRADQTNYLENKTVVDTMLRSVDFCALPGGKGGGFKWPSLTELHRKLFGQPFEDAHDAAYDVEATARCFFSLIQKEVLVPLHGFSAAQVVYEAPQLEESNFAKPTEEPKGQERLDSATTADISHLEQLSFTHLHVHSQYSVLQATCEIDLLIKKAKDMGMSAVGLTDHGNLMAAFKFVQGAVKEGLKPILGCEFNLCKDRQS